MRQVDTTVSFTPASTRPALDQPLNAARPWARACRWGVLAAGCLLWLFAGLPVHAKEPVVQQIGLQRSADALYLSVRLELAPTHAVEDALLKGVPLYFVWQADVYRDRWYWTDKRVASAVRTLRLAYQPLTRRWRLSLSNDPPADSGRAGLQYALHQNFDSLPEALAGVSRVARWKVADAHQLQEGSDQRVEVDFRLDLSLLPRPFQIGMANQPEWLIEVRRRVDVPARAEPEPESAPDASPAIGDAASAPSDADR